MIVTVEEVAQWMAERIDRENFLYQDVVVMEIQSKFGDQFSYLNEAANYAINRDVLAAFRKLTEQYVVWERGERMWRKRQSYDSKGRQQE